MRACQTGLAGLLGQTATLGLTSLLVFGCSPSTRTRPSACKLEVTTDAPGRLALAFLIANPTSTTEIGHYTSPFTAFALTVTSDGQPVAIKQSVTTAARATGDDDEIVKLAIRPGAGVRLVPSVRLAFAPGGAMHADQIPERADSADSGSGEPFAVWTLDHAPAIIEIDADVTIDGLARRHCMATYRPEAP